MNSVAPYLVLVYANRHTRNARVIVGTSFIAMETAASLSRLGLSVTLIDQAASMFPKIQSLTGTLFAMTRSKAPPKGGASLKMLV